MRHEPTTSPPGTEAARADENRDAGSMAAADSTPRKRPSSPPLPDDDGFLMLPNRLLRWPGLSLAAAVAWSGIRDLLKLHGPALGMRMVCRRCGFTRAQFIRAIDELERAGLLRVDRAECRGSGPVRQRRNRYTLVDPPAAARPVETGPVERCENRTVGPERERSEIRTVAEPKRGENRTVYGPEIAPLNGAKIAPCKEQQELNNNGAASPPAAAPPDDGRSAAASMLLAAGVDEGKAAELAGLGPERVAAAVAWGRESPRRNLPGFVVDVLRDAAKRAELDKRAAAERSRRAAATARKSERTAERAAREFVARLPDDQRRGYFPAAVDAICRANPSAKRKHVAAELDAADWSALDGAAMPPGYLVDALARIAAQGLAAARLAANSGHARNSA
ncbi:MAG: hypothetical protein IT450_20675 [Phycisphaerales bacterium]|nr:hypothetical protein [Phycisphaerales bacterium]